MKLTTKIKLPKGGQVSGSVIDIKSMDDLEKIMLTEKYSLGVFENNEILKKKFIETKSIALDFDANYTLKQAVKDFADYKHIIATTKSHQKMKNGVKCDRFRVVIFFDKLITSNEDYYATWIKIAEIFTAADVQCKNSNRWFYPSKKIVSTNKKGKVFSVSHAVVTDKTETKMTIDTLMPLKGKGKLSKTTRRFLHKGLTPGSRNGDTFKIAKDFQENGYSVEDATKYIIKAYQDTNTLSFDFTEFEVENTIISAYNSQPTNEPRRPFKLVPVGELYKIKSKVEWIVSRLLAAGGVSLMSASPKAGKSQIARQMIASILKKEKFLGRRTKYGEIHYYAIEEQPEVINESFKKMGLPSNVPLFVHTGEIFSEDRLKDLKQVLMERKPILVVIDTLFDMLDIENENNYSDVKTAMRNLRQVARETNTHILCIHHSNKSTQGITGSHRGVLGSQAIVGGVDAIILIEMEGAMRVITTMGRNVRPWITKELIWDEETETYTLGDKVNPNEF